MLFIIVLLEGFVTISLEILAIRQLTPVVGNSVIITSLIIGIFLLFLAYGYRKGGSYIGDYQRILKNNFMMAALGFGVGLSYLFVELFFQGMRYIIPNSTLLPLSFYLLIVMAPVVYLLGQTVPITLNLWKKRSSIGEAGGQVLHISTIGSFLGATLTALVLLNFLGVGWSIFIDFMILIILMLVLTNLKREFLRLILAVFLCALVYSINVSFEKNFFVATNNYANYKVMEDPKTQAQQGKILVINDSLSSYSNNKKQGFPYIELIKRIIFDDLKLENKNILVLGAGGFSLSAEKTQKNHFVYVDIDKQIASIVKKHFSETQKGDFVSDDARHFLNTTPQKFDVIVSDAYSNACAIAPHLVTHEYLSTLKKALANNGFAIFNVVARPMLDDPYSKHVDETIRSVFGSCLAIPSVYRDQPSNIIYVCKKSANEGDHGIYRDDLNRASLEFFGLW